MAEAGEFITVATSPPSTSAKPQRRSRAVSNLTRQQVQHKRDQDRRAQRRLREGNKTCVESLESTITCLKSTHAEEIAAKERTIKNLNDEMRTDDCRGSAAGSSCQMPSPRHLRQESVALAIHFSAHTLKGFTARQSGPSVSDAACQTELATTKSTALTRHLAPSTLLDHILLGFLRFHSHPTSTDAAQPLMGGSDVSLKAYLHTELYGSIDPISRLMNEVLSTFAHVRAPEKISFIRAQWQVYPTKSTFADLPRWLRPAATQITVPHDAWIDNIPW
ncbi:conserved hypothetical protein [Verticillium alfalfae VaMs.102]|uniref:BZIP domain-containing protein n=1 Tax=Verticillium alfalfae (strain VaMs.102 / ATCC MYA-4576 / FGSC 10136) TaxID=526221 RepID=C9SMR3_VERA1|nr:conserved hypothetical protein [Verticillium alfalfae VaMs.102]EEY20078.1 conserved hypothetical protein [Verticillium alfalfae VaMs.102]